MTTTAQEISLPIVAEFRGGNTPGLCHVAFIPAFQLPPPLGTRDLPFVEWWNRDIIFRASAAPDQSNPLIIPSDTTEQVPRNKRKTYVRREIIELVRNKLGAHLDPTLTVRR